MPMMTRQSMIAAGLIAFGLLLAACVTETGPSAETDAGQPADPMDSIASAAVTTGDQATTTVSKTPSLAEIPTAEPTIAPVPTTFLPDLGRAPDIKNEIWLNTDRPLNLELLRGEVVLVEFWTFG